MYIELILNGYIYQNRIIMELNEFNDLTHL